MPDPLDLDEAPRRGWRAVLVRLGRWRVVLLITLFSVVASVLVAYPLSVWTGARAEDMPGFMLVAAVVPAVVAPLASTLIVTLFFELEQARAELDHLARHDDLTQVFNRRYFHERFEIETHRARRAATALSLLMVDADHFKALNDRHGHVTGDEVLRQIARAAAAALRPYDMLARFGGEEFVVLLPATSPDQAAKVAERIREAVERLACRAADGRQVAVTVSVGVASQGPGDDDGKALLQRADAALYAAKEAGRNRVASWAPGVR